MAAPTAARWASSRRRAFPATTTESFPDRPGSILSAHRCGALKNTKALLDGYIPAAKFQAVNAAILKQCDKVDGVADGLIQNPAKCTFQPDALVPETLTQKQADALKLIMSPVRDEQGKLIYPGASVGNLGQDNMTVRGPTNYLETPPADPKSAKPWGDAALPGELVPRPEHPDETWLTTMRTRT